MDWTDVLVVVLPSALGLIAAIVAIVLKKQLSSLDGISKEVAELLVIIIDAYEDKKVTKAELEAIIKEGEDVVAEAWKLLM